MSENASGESDSVAKNVRPINRGEVYYMRHSDMETRKSRKMPHYHIVLNKKPILENDLICTAVITSQFDDWQKHAINDGYLEGTFVEIGKGDYDKLEKPSLIDCNRIRKINRQDFERFIAQTDIPAGRREDFPKDLLKTVLARVKKSHLVEDYKRKLIF